MILPFLNMQSVSSYFVSWRKEDVWILYALTLYDHLGNTLNKYTILIRGL